MRAVSCHNYSCLITVSIVTANSNVIFPDDPLHWNNYNKRQRIITHALLLPHTYVTRTADGLQPHHGSAVEVPRPVHLAHLPIQLRPRNGNVLPKHYPLSRNHNNNDRL